MNKQKRFILSLIIFITLVGTLAGQQSNLGVDSPYGRYGYGMLSKPALGATESMGGISYGVRRGTNVNPGNPASYSAADTLNFTMEMGVSGQYSKLSDGIGNQSFKNGNFDYLAFQFPVFKNMGMSVGLLPYSKVGYDFGQDIIDPEISYRETFYGSGGLSQIYAGVAYAPIKQFSLGANVSYLFGSITHSKDIPLLGPTGEASNRQANNSFSIKNVMFDLGVQYTHTIDQTRSMTFGAVYTP
ncbi:MAG: porin family protein, partial [Bacteroidales bacterium]|nr:porin family protein [Bacteroidales bacterium]